MHSHSHNERRMFYALLLTGSFTVAELLGGLYSGSLALLADATHMFTDTAALALAWGAARMEGRPADAQRSYGYQRLQVLAAFVNGVAFIVIVVFIVIEAVQRLFNPPEVLGGVMLVIAILGLLVNITAFALLHGGSKHDLNLQGALLHVMGDLLGSVAAICAAVVIVYTGWMPIDPLLSMLVGGLILFSAVKLVRKSSHILLEGTPEDFDVEKLRKVLHESVPQIEDVHHVHVWLLAPKRPLMTLHVLVNSDAVYADVLLQVKQTLQEKFAIDHATIQIEPSGCIEEQIKT